MFRKLDKRQSAPDTLEKLGKLANKAAKPHVFEDYRSRKSPNTLKNHENTLRHYARYMATLGVFVGEPLYCSQVLFSGITWRLLVGFQKFLLHEGRAISSINSMIATLKIYAKLSMQTGWLDQGEYLLIAAVENYSPSEGKHVDSERPVTWIGHKEAEPIRITSEQAERLKSQPNQEGLESLASIGDLECRDNALLSILLDLGLRVGEVTSLRIEDIDKNNRTIRIARPKTDTKATLDLQNGTFAMIKLYLELLHFRYNRRSGPLWLGSGEDGKLTGSMSERAIKNRVRRLGELVGIAGLNPKDCRHYCATLAARNGTPLHVLMSWFGWKSAKKAVRYIEVSKIGEEGERR